MKKILFCLCWIMAVYAAAAQQAEYLKFTHYSSAEGLGNSNVRRSFEDSNGFIWSATQDGLYCFTGKRFITYNKAEPENRRLEASVVLDLLESGGILWVTSAFGGINGIELSTGNIIYRFDQQKITGYKELVLWSLAKQGDTLFIGSNKGLLMLNMHDPKTPALITIHSSAADNSPLNITKINNDKQTNTLWVFANGKGVYAIDSKSFAIRAFYPESGDYVYDCDISPDHSCWAATSRGLRKYSLSGNTIIPFTVPLPAVKASQDIYTYAVRIYKNDIYFANKNNTVKASLSTGGAVYIKDNSFAREHDWTGAVFGILIDRNGYLWLSGMQGLALSDNRAPAFASYSKSAFSQDVINHARTIYPYNDSLAYVCAEDGLYNVNLTSGSIVTIDKGRSYFFCSADATGNLWVSNDEGTYILKGKKRVPLSVVYPEFAAKGQIVLNSWISIGDSVYVMGTENKRGVLIWDRIRKKVTNLNNSSSPLQLEENIVNTIYRDRSGKIWILSDNSIMLYDMQKNTIRPVPMVNPLRQKQYSIFFDIRELNDTFYISSYGHGVVVLDKNQKFIKEISTSAGLADNGVYKILNYRDSLLFVTTNHGLSVISRKGNQIRNFYSSDGLHADEFEEFSGVVYHDVLYAGGANGFTRIRPANFSFNTITPSLFWNKVSIEKQDGTTDSSNLRFLTVQIPNNAVQTTISFSALNYRNPLRTIFAYKIKELHKDWINIQSRDFINLIGLSPGKYTLLVKAANEDGLWTPEPMEMVLHFLPKWYQTIWFKLLLAAIGVGLLYGFFLYRIGQIKEKQQIRKDIASDLHDDIGSTLNSVKVFMHLVKREPGKKEHIDQIEESLAQATTGLRDMIWVLDDSQDTLLELI